MAATRTAAYFDLDKTVLATSTTFALSVPMRRSGLISAPTLARGIVVQLPYLLFGADGEQGTRLMNQIAAMCAGIERAGIERVVAEAMATAIEPAIYAEAMDLIEAHHQAGHDVVIVSASTEETVLPIARLVGADRAVASRMEVDAEGRFTGRVERSLMHGAKVPALEADAVEHGIDLSSSWAYSDSVSDLPMLQAVGHPVAVNPDRDLRRHATEAGWPVRDFEPPVRVARQAGAVALEDVREALPELWKVGAAAVGLLAVGAAAAWAVTSGPVRLSPRR
ncbi:MULTISPECIES: HAD family hydrolase [unclassified Actinomyces]|uniref:HAD family hydrolase n=1 Tax=unclassified Actinomyces TaxID=2609248 RepID=UPI002017E283|nr:MULTISPECIES: HAD family hydrolase [unclassified Actinomyces]MCL3778746.1 HAD family hydrolase [Actinomyces sp. AC-20-1]MCL3789322.1 HAD family hydrolase [Actinomyces sp. 187325]MCL3792054.1 HAD family hydrolase [Actinomyces sp. 186855]MCL3793989.1 HAD family hydrolase [Actinomyces sp. 217892]